LLSCYYFSGFNGHGNYFQQPPPPPPTSQRKGGFQQKFNPNRMDLIGRSMLYLNRSLFVFFIGNQYRSYPLGKRDDDEYHNLRTSSISSSAAPLPQPLIEQQAQQQSLPNNSSSNVKVCFLFLFD
jgi:hypothetical protein